MEYGLLFHQPGLVIPVPCPAARLIQRAASAWPDVAAIEHLWFGCNSEAHSGKRPLLRSGIEALVCAFRVPAE
jgi:hypothetical protein